MCHYRTIVGGILQLHRADAATVAAELGQDRVLNLPSFSVTLKELYDTLVKVRFPSFINPCRSPPFLLHGAATLCQTGGVECNVQLISASVHGLTRILRGIIRSVESLSGSM